MRLTFHHRVIKCNGPLHGLGKLRNLAVQIGKCCRFIGSREKVEFDAIVKMVKGRAEPGAVLKGKRGI